MKQLITLVLCLLLAACGGGDGSTLPVAAKAPAQAAQVRQGAPIGTQEADYYDVTQRVFVSYFGRPADPAGRNFWALQLKNAGAPTTIKGLNAVYDTNKSVKDIIDFFGTSQESKDLYPGDNNTFMEAIYQNLFSRAADTGGRDFWVGLVTNGALTRSRAAVTLMADSVGSDVTIIDNKVAVAARFTASLDTDAKLKAYSGLAANEVVRAMLKSVSASTNPVAFQSSIDATISKLTTPAVDTVALFSRVQGIIKSRCVGCHSSHPTLPGYSVAPAGITYDTVIQIKGGASSIYTNVVETGFMPFGNMTGMTDEERVIIAQWFELGAP